MSQRFFVDEPIVTPVVTLAGAEAHHLIHVMRAQVGQRVVLFDGSGAEFSAVIEAIGRKQVDLRVQSRDEIDRELPVPLVLAVALPRGDRQEWLVEKAVELGVSRIVPWQTQHSVARANEKSIQRLRRSVIEASKQCGRNRLMVVDPPCEFDQYIERAEAGISVLAHPLAGQGTGTHALTELVSLPTIRHGARIGIGPEGGFSDREVRQAHAAGWHLIDLGRRTLRTETAALALAAQLSILLSPPSSAQSDCSRLTT